MDARDTAELLQQAAGDDDAFRELRDRYKGVVWGATYGYRFDHQTREDIAQLVCLKLFQHLARIRQPERLAGWLATTTRRECVRLSIQRARVDVVAWLDDEPDSGARELDTDLIRDETVRVVAAALLEIDPACQRLLRLLTGEPPLSYAEIADALGIPEGSVGPTRQRCLEKLARRPSIARIGGGAGGSSSVKGEP